MKATQIPEESRAFVYTRDFFRCVRCGQQPRARQWHHRRSRSVRDDHTHESCNGVLLCVTCHTWVHQHPFEARGKGWIVSRDSVPCETPVYAEQHGWVLLDHEGGVSPAPEQEE